MSDELLDLAAAVCNGTITPEQHARLEQLLAADPAARQRYFDYLDLHLALGQTHAAGRVPKARRPRRWIALLRPRRAFCSAPPSTSPTRGPRPSPSSTRARPPGSTAPASGSASATRSTRRRSMP